MSSSTGKLTHLKLQKRQKVERVTNGLYL